MSRQPLVVANWKMHHGIRRTRQWVADFDPPAGDAVEVAVAPPYTSLPALAETAADRRLSLAAQDVHWETKGAFTGEVAPGMLVELGVRYVIVGHSERRTIFGESDERVGHKVDAVRRHDMTPILCVGERQDERDGGATLAVVERQLRRGLRSMERIPAAGLVVAYEPVWAIGTGRVATEAQVDEVHRMIREQLASIYDPQRAAEVRILYGGSVKPGNAAALFSLPEVDGGLVGGASLEIEGFSAIVAAAAPSGGG